MWVINLQQHDAILRTTWMKQLGVVHFNNNKLLMSFLHTGKEIQLQGIKKPHTEVINLPACNYLTIAQLTWMSQIVENYEGDTNISQVS